MKHDDLDQPLRAYCYFLYGFAALETLILIGALLLRHFGILSP